MKRYFNNTDALWRLSVCVSRPLERVRLGVMLGLLTCYSIATAAEAATVRRASGGSIRTVLSQNIVVNQGSSLQREWIALNHAVIPAKFSSTPGVTTKYKDGGRVSPSGYEYTADCGFVVSEAISAIEIRFLTFDVWGERGKSLVMTEVQDFPVGTHKLTGTWKAYSENEVSEFYASIGYIARVRTKDGRVLNADVRPVIEQARKFYSKFAETDLDPEKAPKSGK